MVFCRGRREGTMINRRCPASQIHLLFISHFFLLLVVVIHLFLFFSSMIMDVFDASGARFDSCVFCSATICGCGERHTLSDTSHTTCQQAAFLGTHTEVIKSLCLENNGEHFTPFTPFRFFFFGLACSDANTYSSFFYLTCGMTGMTDVCVFGLFFYPLHTEER